MTFVNSQLENTNSQDDFCTFVLKISDIEKKYESKIYIYPLFHKTFLSDNRGI